MEPGFAWLQAEIEALRREREEKVGPTLDGPSVKAGNKDRVCSNLYKLTTLLSMTYYV